MHQRLSGVQCVAQEHGAVSDHAMLRENTKKSDATVQTLQASASMLNVKAYDSIIIK